MFRAVFLILFYSYLIIIRRLDGIEITEIYNNETMDSDDNLTTFSQESIEMAKMSLTYGSLLSINCKTNNDCILKNSVCNSYTNRCECDYNAIQDENNHCQTLHCNTNQDCWIHFDNTICVFGSCRCKFGLKANGKCVDLDIPGLGGSQSSLPDWAISLIAIAALLGGIYGGRSQFMSQLVRQLLSLFLLVARQFAQNRNRTNNDDDNNNQSSSNRNSEQRQSMIEELQSALAALNQSQQSTVNSSKDYLETKMDDHNNRKSSSLNPNLINELVATIAENTRQQSHSQRPSFSNQANYHQHQMGINNNSNNQQKLPHQLSI